MNSDSEWPIGGLASVSGYLLNAYVFCILLFCLIQQLRETRAEGAGGCPC